MLLAISYKYLGEGSPKNSPSCKHLLSALLAYHFPFVCSQKTGGFFLFPCQYFLNYPKRLEKATANNSE